MADHSSTNTSAVGPNTYDVIILGASGFTGKYLIREALKFLNASNSPLKSLALAGRSPARLLEALKWAAGPGKVVPKIPLIEADTSDTGSLSRLAAQAKIILNCVGPFGLYGESVISACVDAGCDYLDICGETGFSERMEALYHDKAVGKGSLVVLAAAFESIIAETGMFFHSRQWTGPSAPNRIDAYWSMESDKKITTNFGSYKSLLGLASADDDELVELPERPRPEIPGPEPSKGSVIERQKKLGLWTLDTSVLDVDIVRRTLSTLVENPRGICGVNESEEHSTKREAFWSTVKPAHFSERFVSKQLIIVLSIVVLWNWMRLLGKFALGRWLLLKFPSFFSFGMFPKDGPTEDEVTSVTFKMWFVGHSYSDRSLALKGSVKPDTEVITRVSGPQPGYVATPIILIQCALMLLNHRGNFPKGGVYTPGIVFGPTDLQERLQENGISFELISKGPLYT